MKIILKYLGYFAIVSGTVGTLYGFHSWSKKQGAKEVKEISYEGSNIFAKIDSI